ncbi:MAG TPA: TetR/AcrR family transcriptional regulator [Candidatus Thioglobus sp.]|nr:TetR/AcrR family transcriptional regulator [Candidatus Thioglobus sp.]
MARPSLKQERQKIILQAFTECIAAKGLNATTLDDIALKSQMRRSLLRHNVGNRTELINQVAEYVSTEFETIWREQRAQYANDNKNEWLLKILFNSNPDEKYQALIPAFFSLLASAHRYPEVTQRLKKCFNVYLDDITQELVRRHPKASENECRQVSLGIVGIFFNWDSFLSLDLGEEIAELNLQMVHRLLSTLKK